MGDPSIKEAIVGGKRALNHVGRSDLDLENMDAMNRVEDHYDDVEAIAT